MTRQGLLLMLLVLWVAPVHAAPQIWAAWQLDLDGEAPPSAFLLTVTSPTGTSVPPAMEVPWASCTAVPSAQHCAPIGCPPTGTYDFAVRAVYAEGPSDPSNIFRCTTVRGVCGCTEVSPGPPPPPPPPPVTRPPPVPRPPLDMPPLSTVIPPLVPVGEIPALPTVPAIPPSAGA
jgi:hypothetical protein